MMELADAGGGVFYEVERLSDLAGALRASWSRIIVTMVQVWPTVRQTTLRATARVRERISLRRQESHETPFARGIRGFLMRTGFLNDFSQRTVRAKP
jgi:hypothetical protein